MPQPDPSTHFELVRDPQAGYLTVSPIPSLETLQNLYAHEYYVREKPTYLVKSHRESAYWDALWSMRLQAMAEAVNGPGTILDIGASGGFFLNRARQLGWRVAGIEPGYQPTAYAAEHFQINHFNGYLEDYVHNGPLFDAVHMSLVLEHVRCPRQFLNTALQQLRSGGVIWIEVPNDFNPFQNAIVNQLEKPQWWVVPQHHLNYFNFQTLANLMAERDLGILKQTTSFPMELFVLMGMDYIGNDDVGSKAHGMRMTLEQNLLATNPDLLDTLYTALADKGLGRTCNIMAIKP